MTFPNVAARSSGTTNSGGNGTSHTINLPTGIAAGDLLVAIITFGTSTVGTITTTGWTRIDDVVSSVRTVSFCYKTATGSEGATATFTTSSNTKDSYSCYRIAAGTWSGTPERGAIASGTGTAPDPPSLSPSWGAKDTLWIAGVSLNTQTPSAAPANYSNMQGGESSSGSGIGLSTAERTLNIATEDPGSFTITSTGWSAQTWAIAPVQAIVGTLTRTEANDTLSGAGKLALNGTLTRTEAADTLSSSADLFLNGSLTRTEAPDIFASTGALEILGALDEAEVADALTADGTLGGAALPEIVGTLTAAEASDTLAAAGAVDIQATLTATEAADTLASAGIVPLTGSLIASEIADTLLSNGSILTGGSLVATEAADTVASAAKLALQATLTANEAADVLSSAAKLAIIANLTRAEASDTLASSGIILVLQASLTQLEQPDTLFAFAGVTINGMLNTVEADDTVISTATISDFAPRVPVTRRRSTNLASSRRPTASTGSRPPNLN